MSGHHDATMASLKAPLRRPQACRSRRGLFGYVPLWRAGVAEQQRVSSARLRRSNRSRPPAAVKKIGLKALPALIRAVDAEKAFLLNLTENIQRRDLSNAERARAMQILANLADGRGERLTLAELQQRIQKSRATISTWIRIGRCAPLRDALESDRIDVGRAMALTPLAREDSAGPWQVATWRSRHGSRGIGRTCQ